MNILKQIALLPYTIFKTILEARQLQHDYLSKHNHLIGK